MSTCISRRQTISIIAGQSYYKVESVLSVLKKEINENNYQEIINLLNESKYNNDFEIRGFLFAYLIDKKIEEPTNIIKNLNVDILTMKKKMEKNLLFLSILIILIDILIITVLSTL